MELGVTTKPGNTMTYHIEVIPQKYRMKKWQPDQVIDLYYKSRSGLIYALVAKEEDFEAEEGGPFLSTLNKKKT